VSDDSSRLSERAARLRREFDDAFARPPVLDQVGSTELLVIRVGPDPHAIRLAEIAGLHADRCITRFPGPLPELLGLVSLRGALVPVYDLRLLLGYTAASSPPRWMVVAAATPVGLAFDQLEGHVTVQAGAIVAELAPGTGRTQPRDVVHGSNGARSILLHVPSLVNEIAARDRRARKEH